MPFFTEKQAHIHSGINGINMPRTKSWSSFEGGDLQSTTSTLHPGGMQPSLAMPGPVQRTNVTVKRPYDKQLHNFGKHIEAHVGRARMWASFTPLDAQGNPNGETVTRNGYLKECTIPNWDSASGTATYLALVMECDQ
jgi:hypothetical protein